MNDERILHDCTDKCARIGTAYFSLIKRVLVMEWATDFVRRLLRVNEPPNHFRFQ